tara:strand:- start:247 stop:1233 length:987 start_codon:yes stop_codon:yes gene_type:complete
LTDYFKSKAVLVAGGAGFVGTNLIKKLIILGANVSATLHKNTSMINNENINYINCDLRKPEDCKKVCKTMDYVFMCAANTSGAKVISTTPLVHMTPNIIMNINMLEAAYETGVEKFLFISSNTVYPNTDFPVRESDVNNQFYESYHIVAWMKRFTEIICDIYSNRIKNPMKTVIIRPGNLYGPYDKFDWEKSKVIPALIRRSLEKHDPFIVWGDGMDIKDFLYIDDFVEGLILAMEKIEDFQPVNIASGKPVTIRDALDQILHHANYQNANIEYDLSMPTMIPKRIIDIALANELLNWEPKISLQEGIGRTIDWYKETFHNKTPESLI